MLVVDTGSPLVSVAVGGAHGVAGLRVVAPPRSSQSLLRWIAETLVEAGLELRELTAFVGLRGPGSFTGLRVGLATLLGLHQATGIPAGTVETLDVLASVPAADGAPVRTLAVVDALRGQWFTRLYADSDSIGPLEEPRLRRPGELAALAPCRVVGFGSLSLVEAGGNPPGLHPLDPGPLAPLALRGCVRQAPPWDAASLTAPTYLRLPLG